jgi:hypothetical protein
VKTARARREIVRAARKANETGRVRPARAPLRSLAGVPVPCGSSPPAGLLSWDFAAPSEVWARVRSPATGYQARPASPARSDRRDFLARAAAGPRLIRQHPLLGLRVPSEYDRNRLPAPSPVPAGSREVRSLSALAESGVHLPRRNPSRRYVPPAGFRTLSAGSSSRPLRACFIPVALVGFVPFEAFPFRRSPPPRRWPLYPHAVGRSPASGC